jgi:hypothetical protein
MPEGGVDYGGECRPHLGGISQAWIEETGGSWWGAVESILSILVCIHYHGKTLRI